MATLIAQENMVGLPIVYQVNTDQVDGNGGPVPRNISAFTTKELIFRKPNGVKVTKTATFFTDGTDGLLLVTSIAGDLAPYGVFRVQAHLSNASLDETTEVDLFSIARNV